MDALSEDAQSIKIPALSLQEGTKKKKQSRKKPENKPSKPELEVPEPIPELTNDLDADLVAYTYKLEAELSSAKKKLKSQRNKFRHLIHCLSENIDAKGITANIVEEYLQTVNTRLSDVGTESPFEKFFTTHKYRILEESGHQQDHALHKEGPNKKTSSKAATNMLKSSTAEKTPTNGDALLHSHSPLEDPQGGTTTKKPKKEKAAKTNGEGEVKKQRKPKEKKHKESDDMSEDVVEILEIPPPKTKPKKDDNAKAIQQQQQQLQQQQQQQIPPLQTNNMMEEQLKALMQVGMDPTALMNAYLMAGQGIPGMSEGDLAMYMGKTLQDLMKMGTHTPGRGGDQSTNDMLNYYQRNFQ